MTTLAIIDTNTNVCVNVTLDDRAAIEVNLPSPYIAIDLEVTPNIDWVMENEQLVAVESIGSGGIGDTYENGKLVDPK